MSYPADIVPVPVACYSTEKLTAGYAGSPLIISKATSDTADVIGFSGDHLADISTVLAGEPYGKVSRLNNQMSSTGDAVSGSGAMRPRIHPNYKIGPSPCLMFEGGTNSGQLFGLDIPPAINTLGISPTNWTVMAVLRPTTSIYRNQQFTPGLGEGTILSLEGSVPFQYGGTTTLGSATITNVTPNLGISPGMEITSIAFSVPVRVLTVTPDGPSSVAVTVFGAVAGASFPTVTLLVTNPLIRLYQNGDATPGSFAWSDHNSIVFSPTEFSGCEIRPVVVTWTQNNLDATTDVVGSKAYQNEIVRSSADLSFRSDTVLTGYIGRMGGSQPGGQSRCGDFWLAALLIWNVHLTQAQATIVRAALYERFAINYLRSTRASKSVTIVGDSIAMDYVTLGNYGWSKRLADKFPDNIRFMNYAVPGSQVITSEGMPVYGHSEGMFPLSVAGQMNYSKVGKNVLIMLGGGNDMTNVVSFKCTVDVATDTVSVFNDGIVTVDAAVGNILTFDPTGMAILTPTLSVGALVEGITNPASIPGGTTVTAIDATLGRVTISNSVTGVLNGDSVRFRYHNMAVGGRMLFITLPSDTLGNLWVTGVTTNTVYYIKTVTAPDKYTLALTPSGATINIAATGAGPTTGVQTIRNYPKTAAQIFGTPTTHGLQKIVADATAAGASKVYLCTVLPRVGLEYAFIREELNALIMGGGAGGYTALDSASETTLANNNIPVGTIGPGYFDSGHLNEVGSQAMADFVYPTLLAYLNS